MKKFIKFSITTLGAIAILGTSVIAATGTVNSQSGLVLRQEADKNSNPITTVPAQAVVDILEKNGEWYKVKYNEQDGYLYAEYVKTEDEITTTTTDVPQNTAPTENESTASTDNNQTSNKIKVYNIPLITSTVINEIPENTEIKVQKQITNWSYVTAGEIQGWVRTYAINGNINQPESTVEPETKTSEVELENENKEIIEETEQEEKPAVDETTPDVSESEENQQEETPSTEPQKQPTTVTTGTVNVDYANVRKEASTSSEVLTTLTRGTSFNIQDETEEWYKINYTGVDGIVYNGYISKTLVTAR